MCYDYMTLNRCPGVTWNFFVHLLLWKVSCIIILLSYYVMSAAIANDRILENKSLSTHLIQSRNIHSIIALLSLPVWLFLPCRASDEVDVCTCGPRHGISWGRSRLHLGSHSSELPHRWKNLLPDALLQCSRTHQKSEQVFQSDNGQLSCKHQNYFLSE